MRKNNEVLFQYIVVSIIAIIKKWLNNGTAESPEYIADIIIKIASLLIE
ncbi:MAG: TetR family transcriptional regulator C-terminal domain-containing protein [Ruminococcus sp.]|nr:TetR family transcriptional regulator C-terminal domain-containing protein [Ruminococcus sp.]